MFDHQILWSKYIACDQRLKLPCVSLVFTEMFNRPGLRVERKWRQGWRQRISLWCQKLQDFHDSEVDRAQQVESVRSIGLGFFPVCKLAWCFFFFILWMLVSYPSKVLFCTPHEKRLWVQKPNRHNAKSWVNYNNAVRVRVKAECRHLVVLYG